MSIISICFKKNGKQYYFLNEEFDININDKVIVNTEQGLQLGIVVDNNIDESKVNIKSELKTVLKKADDKDYNTYLNNLKDSKIVVEETKKKIEKDKIPMTIVDANYTFDKKQLTINFVADERIDFRNLVKYLAAKYKTHIDLHQIGVRDKAKEIGGIGVCGLPLCCKTFKNDIQGITINMAKNQNIALNPTKINGCCGRLLCCLAYEDEGYTELREKLPKINDDIKVDGKKGKVANLDILRKKVYVNINDEIKEVDFDVK